MLVGVCDICAEKVALDIDHDHATDEIRGHLCRRCNLLLGMVKDDTALLSKAIAYLDNPPRLGTGLYSDYRLRTEDKRRWRWKIKLKYGLNYIGYKNYPRT